MGFLTLSILLLFADAANVSRVTALGEDGFRRLIIVAFVQAQMLWRFLRWLRTFHHNGIQGRRQKQVVVYVCACDADSQGAASFFNKQALFDAQLATVGGVRADAFAFGFNCF